MNYELLYQWEEVLAAHLLALNGWQRANVAQFVTDGKWSTASLPYAESLIATPSHRIKNGAYIDYAPSKSL